MLRTLRLWKRRNFSVRKLIVVAPEQQQSIWSLMGRLRVQRAFDIETLLYRRIYVYSMYTIINFHHRDHHQSHHSRLSMKLPPTSSCTRPMCCTRRHGQPCCGRARAYFYQLEGRQRKKRGISIAFEIIEIPAEFEIKCVFINPLRVANALMHSVVSTTPKAKHRCSGIDQPKCKGKKGVKVCHIMHLMFSIPFREYN